jgi:hypothetical protein
MREVLIGLIVRSRFLRFVNVSNVPYVDDGIVEALASKMIPGAEGPVVQVMKTNAHVGCRVRLVELQSASELNGQEGTCREWLTDKQRWKVLLHNSMMEKQVKPQNLEIVDGMEPKTYVDVSCCTRVTLAGVRRLHNLSITVGTHKCWRLLSPDAMQTPAEVVEVQVLALGAARAENLFEEGVGKCFEYASPGNKANTGPAERFGHMIRLGYSVMMCWDSYSITVLQSSGAQATFQVRFHVSHRRDQCFQWMLSKQTCPEHLDCWMTDAVVPC